MRWKFELGWLEIDSQYPSGPWYLRIQRHQFVFEASIGLLDMSDKEREQPTIAGMLSPRIHLSAVNSAMYHLQKESVKSPVSL